MLHSTVIPGAAHKDSELRCDKVYLPETMRSDTKDYRFALVSFMCSIGENSFNAGKKHRVKMILDTVIEPWGTKESSIFII